MSTFLREFADRMGQINSREDLKLLYHWIWEHPAKVAETAALINAELGLADAWELKPDLPCVSVGSTSGLVILAANPGWKPELNALEEGYCKRSPDHYVDMMTNFFEVHPRERNYDYSTWWSKAMRFTTLLPDAADFPPLPKDKAERWDYILKTQTLGGWELFPWHSTKDGVTGKMERYSWLGDFCRASVRAAFGLHPKMLFVASSAGYSLVRHDVFGDLPWRDADLSDALCSFAKTLAGSEIVAINRNILGDARRKFTDHELFAKVRELRELN